MEIDLAASGGSGDALGLKFQNVSSNFCLVIEVDGGGD